MSPRTIMSAYRKMLTAYLGMNRMDSLRWRYSDGWGHEAALLEIHASVHVKFRPMAVLAARRSALSEAPVRKLLECAVDPTEAKSLFHDINVLKYARRGSLPPAHDNPALLFLGAILLQPISKLRAV